MAYDRGRRPGFPTEPVGSLPRPAKLQAAYADYDAGKITKEQLEAEQDAGGQGLDQPRSRRPGRRSSPTASSAGRASRRIRSPTRWRAPASADGLAPGGQYFAIFADGHDRQLPRLTRRAVPLQGLRGRHAGEVDRVRDQADEAGGDRALDAGAAVSARRGGAGLLARAVRGRPGRRMREGHSPRVRRRRGARLDRLHRRPARAREPIRATRGRARGMLPHFIELNNRVLDRFTRRGARATSASTPARAAIATRCTAPTCRTATCCRACSR